MAGSNGDGILKLALGCVVFGVMLVRSGLVRMRQTRRVQDMGSIKIASAPQGLVEIEGFAWPTEVLESPLEHKPCVYYRYEVQELRGGKHRKWTTIYKEDSSQPFFLADESGHAIIYPHNAELEVRARTESWSSLPPAVKNRIRDRVCTRHAGFSGGSGIFGKRVRVREAIIPPGSPLYALGTFASTGTTALLRPANGLRLFLEKVRQLQTNPARAKTLLDTDRDGRLSFEEWYRGYYKTAVAASGGFQNEPLVLPRGMQHASGCFGAMRTDALHKLYLADCHQKELLNRIGNYNIARILGGALLIAGGIVLACGHFKVLI